MASGQFTPSSNTTSGGVEPLPLTIWHAVGLGLAVRLLALAFLPDQQFPDATAYETAGRELVDRGWMGVHIYMPLYPLWTALWDGHTALKLADIALSAATIWLVWRLALETFASPVGALLAAFAAAVYPHFIFFAVSRLTETPYIFLICLAFLLLYRGRFTAASVVLVLSILLRPATDFFAPILTLVFVLLDRRRSWRFAVSCLARYFVIYAVLMAPWWAHQYAKYGQFVRLDLGDGIVLYSGNNPLNQSGGSVDVSEKGRDFDLTPFVEIEAGIERNTALRRAAFDYIAENPGRFVAMAGIKFVRFWRLWPYAPEYEKPAIIILSLASYGVVLGLALVYLARDGLRFWRPVLPMVLFAAFLTAVHMVTVSSVRYRLPVEPFLILLAAQAMRPWLESMPWLGRWMGATVRAS